MNKLTGECSVKENMIYWYHTIKKDIITQVRCAAHQTSLSEQIA